MISNSKQGKEDETGKAPSSSSLQLLRSKDPRIVRVSRAFGGKDRHSKVFTIRGLRDRRVRLSVPTAIQLYDLQDRLGLNQPSKVIDWLLNEAKHEIEELPPLPNIPQGNFALNHQLIPLNASREHIKRDKSKEIVRESSSGNKGSEADYGLQRSNHSSMPQLLNNAVQVPYGSYYHFEPSNFGLSHIGSHGFAAPHSSIEELHSTFNFVPLPSTLSLSSGSQVNHFQMLSSGSQNPMANPSPYSMSQPLRPFHLSITPRLHPDKEHEFPSK